MNLCSSESVKSIVLPKMIERKKILDRRVKTAGDELAKCVPKGNETKNEQIRIKFAFGFCICIFYVRVNGWFVCETHRIFHARKALSLINFYNTFSHRELFAVVSKNLSTSTIRHKPIVTLAYATNKNIYYSR